MDYIWDYGSLDPTDERSCINLKSTIHHVRYSSNDTRTVS